MSMLNVFIFCSVLGGTILVIQTILAFIGIGESELDVDVDTGGDLGDVDTADGEVGHGPSTGFSVFKVVSFRTVVAGVAFFGLAGWGTLISTESEILAIVAAVAAGLAAILLVYFVYRWMNSLRYQGNVSQEKLLGATGSVYVRIPSQGKGAGKVLVTQQSRTMEYEAFSVGKELATGTQVTVSKVISPTSVEVTEVR